jgi:hypothetical protein
MSVAQDLESPEDGIFPPGDLYSDEPPLETDLHRLQMNATTFMHRVISPSTTVHASVNQRSSGGQIFL